MKNWSSVDRMGRGVSMGIQYLWISTWSAADLGDAYTKIPNCMQLIFKLSSSSLLLNKFPNFLNLFTWTRLKTFRIMEDKVASMICNLMLNIMSTPLTICCMSEGISILLHFWLTSIDGTRCLTEGVNFLPKSCWICWSGLGISEVASCLPNIYTVTLKTVPMFGHPEEIDQTCNEIKLNN